MLISTYFKSALWIGVGVAGALSVVAIYNIARSK